MGLKPPREADIQKQILDWLRLHGFTVFRFNCGGMTVKTRFVRFNSARGCSDILGLAPPSGRLIAVEVKRPGKKPTALQSAFLEQVRAAGGFACVASSIEELQSALQEEGLG